MNSTPSADPKVLFDEGAKAKWLADSTPLIEADEEESVAHGVQVVQVGDAQEAKIKRAWAESIWEITSQKLKTDVEALRAAARAKGLD